MLVEPEGLRHLRRRALAEDAERGVELLGLELPTDELAERTGGAAGGERGLRKRRRETLEVALDLRARRREGPLAGRIVGEKPLREPHCAEVERARPGRAPVGGADDRLGGAAAYVADRDAVGQASGRRDRPSESEPTLLVRGEDANRRPRRAGELVRRGGRRSRSAALAR